MLTRDLLAADTPTSADDGYALYSVTPAGTAVTLDTDANQTWAKNVGFAFVAPAGQGVITITPAVGVTVDGSNDPITVPEGTELALVNVDGVDAWQQLDELPSEVIETGAAVTLAAKHMNRVLRAAGTAAQVLTVDAATGSVTDWVEVVCENPNGVTITAGTGSLSPSGDVVLSYGQSATMFQRAVGVWQVFAPAPPASSAEATATSPAVTVREWSPYRIQEAIYARTPEPVSPAPSGLTGGINYWVPGVSIGEDNAVALTANRGVYQYFLVSRPITLTAIRCSVSVAGGTVLRMSVVKCATDWSIDPAGLMTQGTVDPSTAGVKELSGLSVVLHPGLYVGIMSCDGAPTVHFNFGLPSWGVAFDPAGVASSHAEWYFRDGLGTAALANPVPGPTDMATDDTVGLQYWMTYATGAV